MRTQRTTKGNRDTGSSCLCDRGLHRYLQNFGGGGLNTPNPPSVRHWPQQIIQTVSTVSCGFVLYHSVAEQFILISLPPHLLLFRLSIFVILCTMFCTSSDMIPDVSKWQWTLISLKLYNEPQHVLFRISQATSTDIINKTADQSVNAA